MLPARTTQHGSNNLCEPFVASCANTMVAHATAMAIAATEAPIKSANHCDGRSVFGASLQACAHKLCIGCSMQVRQAQLLPAVHCPSAVPMLASAKLCSGQRHA